MDVTASVGDLARILDGARLVRIDPDQHKAFVVRETTRAQVYDLSNGTWCPSGSVAVLNGTPADLEVAVAAHLERAASGTARVTPDEALRPPFPDACCCRDCIPGGCGDACECGPRGCPCTTCECNPDKRADSDAQRLVLTTLAAVPDGLWTNPRNFQTQLAENGGADATAVLESLVDAGWATRRAGPDLYRITSEGSAAALHARPSSEA